MEENTQTPPKEPLTYEETPPIEPIAEPEMFPPKKPKNTFFSVLTTIIIFALLFIVGFWLSGIVRKYIATFSTGGTNKEISAPTPTPRAVEKALIQTTTEGTEAAWKIYPVLNGKTKVAYEGISFKLPSQVLSPICDGSRCASQGTYLPGGTRFTVALRGTGQVLPDYRGKSISDKNGILLTVQDVTKGGILMTEFSGSFIGTTVGGYVFSQMHGYMMPVTDTISMEINHFAPNGITTDFVSDDALFEEIMQTLVLPISSVEKGGVSSSSSTVPTATPTETLRESSPSATPTL